MITYTIAANLEPTLREIESMRMSETKLSELLTVHTIASVIVCGICPAPGDITARAERLLQRVWDEIDARFPVEQKAASEARRA